MSRSVDLFIAAPDPLDAVAEKISELAKVTVVADPEGRWVIREGETSAWLSGHRYIDDGDLFLSRYPWVLSGRTQAASRPQDTPEAALLRHVASALQLGTSWGVLLVLDLQYRENLAVAGPSGPPACDAAGPPVGGPVGPSVGDGTGEPVDGTAP